MNKKSFHLKKENKKLPKKKKTKNYLKKKKTKKITILNLFHCNNLIKKILGTFILW